MDGGRGGGVNEVTTRTEPESFVEKGVASCARNHSWCLDIGSMELIFFSLAYFMFLL